MLPSHSVYRKAGYFWASVSPFDNGAGNTDSEGYSTELDDQTSIKYSART